MIPKKCVKCIHHRKSDCDTDYCEYIEHWNGFANTPVPYPNFYKQEYKCPGHKEE